MNNIDTILQSADLPEIPVEAISDERQANILSGALQLVHQDAKKRSRRRVVRIVAAAAAAIAVQSLAAIPQLGFIHEDSGQSFVLDIADLFRDSITLPIAFAAASKALGGAPDTIDRLVRREAATVFRKQSVIPSMIDKIKVVLRMEEVDAAGSDSDA